MAPLIKLVCFAYANLITNAAHNSGSEFCLERVQKVSPINTKFIFLWDNSTRVVLLVMFYYFYPLLYKRCAIYPAKISYHNLPWLFKPVLMKSDPFLAFYVAAPIDFSRRLLFCTCIKISDGESSHQFLALILWNSCEWPQCPKKPDNLSWLDFNTNKDVLEFKVIWSSRFL